MHASLRSSAEIKGEIHQHVKKIYRVAALVIVGIVVLAAVMRTIHNNSVSARGGANAVNTIIR